MFSKKPEVELPSGASFLEEDIDGTGNTLIQHAKSTVEEILQTARGGLLTDAPTVEDGVVVTRADQEEGRFRPRIIFYNAEQIINWRHVVVGGETLLSLLVLREETEVDDDGFESASEPRWRVYRLEEGSVTVEVWKLKNDIEESYDNGEDDFELEQEPVFISDTTGNAITKIPFTFIGALNNDSTVDESPLYPLAALNIAHYRNSADYEHSTFLVGNPTPVFTGLTEQWMKKFFVDKKIVLGSASAVGLPQGANAMLLQPSPNSQPMEAMNHKEELMKAIGAKLVEPNAASRTATEAMIEETSEASVLASIAENVSAAYTEAIINCGLFIDVEFTPETVIVELNSEFQVASLNAQDRQEVVAAWQSGVLAWEEARSVYRRNGIATLSDDEAKTRIDAELATAPNGGFEE